MRKRFGIYNAAGALLEGGFFSKTAAEAWRDREYLGATVRPQPL